MIKLRKITFQIGDELKRKFMVQCAESGVSQRHVIINLISKWLKKNDKNTNNS